MRKAGKKEDTIVSSSGGGTGVNGGVKSKCLQLIFFFFPLAGPAVAPDPIMGASI